MGGIYRETGFFDHMVRINSHCSHQLRCFVPSFSLLAMSIMTIGVQAAEPIELPEVVVTATRSAKPVDETHVASYVVTAAQMEQRNIKTIDEAVNLIPGIFQRRGKAYMDTLSEISMRGVPGGKRSLILLDGLSINDAYDNSAKLGGFAPDDIERIEVSLGPGSSLYGSSAMGGVINFSTRMPKGEEYRFKLGYGDGLGTERAPAHLKRAYVSAGNAWDNGLSLILSFAGTVTDGYVSDYVTTSTAPTAGISGAIRTQTTSGRTTYIIGDRGDNAWKDQQVSLRGKFKATSDTSLSASYTHAAYRYEYNDFQTYLRNASGAQVWSYGTVREAIFLPGQGEYARDIYNLVLDTRIGDSTLKVQGGVIDIGTNWYTTVSSTSTTATRAGGAAAAGYSQTPSRSSQLEATVNTPLFDRHLLVWGFTWRGEKADTSEYNLADWRSPGSRTALAADSGGKATTKGAFAQFDLDLVRGLHTYVGARYDKWDASDGYAHNYAPGGFSQTYAGKSAEAVSPRIGLAWTLNPAVTLRASAGKAFRAPSIYDLYRTWKSSTTVYAGNPQLNPETMKGYDLGGDFKPWHGAELKLTYFHNDFYDMIYRRTVTSNAEKLTVCGTTALACQGWVNAGKATSQGVELFIRQMLTAHWNVFGGYTFNDTEIRENSTSPASVGKQFTQVPRKMASLGTEWQMGDWSASGVIRYVAKRYNTDTNTDTVNGVPGSYDPYTLVDLRAGYRINRHLKASLSVDNVMNKDYYAFYRAPGRAWFLELAGDF
jgi:iron complex outermembrane receptor protein